MQPWPAPQPSRRYAYHHEGRGAEPAGTAGHDQKTAELARYKLGVHAASDADGYRRHACPATTGKIRCPLRPESMTLDRDRPEILAPPQHPQACCTQKTITARRWARRAGLVSRSPWSNLSRC
jgi:hypothetical protein